MYSLHFLGQKWRKAQMGKMLGLVIGVVIAIVVIIVLLFMFTGLGSKFKDFACTWGSNMLNFFEGMFGVKTSAGIC